MMPFCISTGGGSQETKRLSDESNWIDIFVGVPNGTAIEQNNNEEVAVLSVGIHSYCLPLSVYQHQLSWVLPLW